MHYSCVSYEIVVIHLETYDIIIRKTIGEKICSQITKKQFSLANRKICTQFILTRVYFST